MKVEQAEIYSDATNMAVMKHPGRAFPGVLIQGDSLFILWQQAERVCQGIARGTVAIEDATYLRDLRGEYLTHYKMTMTKHEMKLPFVD